MSRSFKSSGLAELREIGDVILLPKKGKMLNMDNKVLVLNDVAAYLWKLMERGLAEDNLVENALETYEVEKSVLVADVKYFLDTLEYIQLIKPRKAVTKETQVSGQVPSPKLAYRTPKIYIYNLETQEEVAYGPHIRGASGIHRAIMRAYHGGCC
jgi:hypothetical protein